MRLTKSFLTELKQTLDNGTWSFEASSLSNTASFEAEENAVEILNKLTFSIKLIKDVLIEKPMLITDCDFSQCNDHQEAIDELCKYIAYDIAIARIGYLHHDYNEGSMFTFKK